MKNPTYHEEMQNTQITKKIKFYITLIYCQCKTQIQVQEQELECTKDSLTKIISIKKKWWEDNKITHNLMKAYNH